MSAEEARFAAVRAFGNPTLIREQTRAVWTWNWLERLLRNLKYGVRTLWRSPSFSIVSVLVMALGIGATTSLFTIVRAVLLRPLPFRDPGRLVMLYDHFRHDERGDGFSTVAAGDYRDWRAQSHGFEDMAAMRAYGGIISGVQSELPEVVQSAAGSANLFPLLGVSPVLGRTFTDAEDQPEGQPVVLLTWSIFQRRFAGDPSIIGKQVHLDTKPTTVIGVLPSWFTYPDAKIQFWLPYAQTFSYSPGDYGHADHQSMVVARLKPGVSAAAATREVSALQYQIHLANASKPVAEDVWFRPMIDDLAKNVRTPLLVLLGAVGCMLLIACLNLTNLLVARSATRRREVAVRGALGGSRVVLICEQMTESLLICLAGGALGLLLSLASTYWLAAHWRNLPRAESVHVDGWVLAFTLGPGSRGSIAGRPCARNFVHRKRAAFGAARFLANDGRQRLPGAAAQDDADSGNRPYGCPVDLGRPALQELPASTHNRSRVPHRPRDHHEIRPARNPVRYARKGRALPRGVARATATPAWRARRGIGFRSTGGGLLIWPGIQHPGAARTQLQPSVRSHHFHCRPAVFQRDADSTAARPRLHGTRAAQQRSLHSL